MIRSRLFLIGPIAVLAVLGVACVRHGIDPDLRGAVVRIEPDSVLLEQTPQITSFKVNVIIRNDRATPLYLGGCGPDAQEEINGHWETVWAPVCIDSQSSTIAPHDSVVFPFIADRFTGPAFYPRLDPKATPGRYRLELGTIYSRPPIFGLVYRGRPVPVKVLGILRSPVFIVYTR